MCPREVGLGWSLSGAFEKEGRDRLGLHLGCRVTRPC